MKYYASRLATPVGEITLASDGDALVGAWICGQKHFGGATSAEFGAGDGLWPNRKAANWLQDYFAGEKPEVDFPLAPKGGEFRQEVWRILRAIPYGECLTYGEIAKMIAKKRSLRSMSAQAVGGAVGRNPIAIIIPCHRVIGRGGNLTGYAAGLDVKIKLLELEGARIKN